MHDYPLTNECHVPKFVKENDIRTVLSSCAQKWWMTRVCVSNLYRWHGHACLSGCPRALRPIVALLWICTHVCMCVCVHGERGKIAPQNFHMALYICLDSANGMDCLNLKNDCRTRCHCTRECIRSIRYWSFLVKQMNLIVIFGPKLPELP